MKRTSGLLGACVVACAVQFAGCDDDVSDESKVVTDAQAGAAGNGGAGGTGGVGGTGGGSGGTGGSGIMLDAASNDAASCGDFGNNDACAECLEQDCCSEMAA